MLPIQKHEVMASRRLAFWILACTLGACSGGSQSPPESGEGVSLPCANEAREHKFPDYIVTPVEATASSSERDAVASSVYDDFPGTYWDSGGLAPQWIMLDFGSPRAVKSIRLCVYQRRSGVTSHQIHGGLTTDNQVLISELTTTTVGGQVQVVDTPASSTLLVRYLRIRTVASPDRIAWGKIEVLASATNIPDYFGYYGDAFSWLTPSTSEVLGHVNLSWVSSGMADLSNLLQALEYAQQAGLKVALAVPQDLFFRDDLVLANRYLEKWALFAEQIRPYIDQIAFIYPIDEPYSQAKVAGINPGVMKRRLELVGSVIKATFPDKPLAFSFSAIDFDIQDSAFASLANPIPVGYDWFGFDCYGSWESCGEPLYRSVHPIPWYINQIKARLSPSQRVFLFPDAFVQQSNPVDAGIDEIAGSKRLRLAEKYVQLALSEPAVVGVFPFLYQDDYVEGSVRFLGVRHWPMLKLKYEVIGKAIAGK